MLKKVKNKCPFKACNKKILNHINMYYIKPDRINIIKNY